MPSGLKYFAAGERGDNYTRHQHTDIDTTALMALKPAWRWILSKRAMMGMIIQVKVPIVTGKRTFDYRPHLLLSRVLVSLRVYELPHVISPHLMQSLRSVTHKSQVGRIKHGAHYLLQQIVPRANCHASARKALPHLNRLVTM
jgi:hypothetical protein